MSRLGATSHWRRWLALVLLLGGLQQLSAAALIHAKAWLAPVLIDRAWSLTLAGGGAPVKPWSWADTWPVARLEVPALDVDLLVLAGDSGNALAFGPGHAWASAALGSPGLAVIGGHRDTHFAFLRDLWIGAQLQLQLADGRRRAYRVEALEIVDASRERLLNSIIPIVDDFERAFQLVPENETDSTWVEGFTLILRKLQGALLREGVTVIEAEGNPLGLKIVAALLFAVHIMIGENRHQWRVFNSPKT